MEIRDTKEYKSMTSFDACATIEGFCGHENATQEELAAAWQYLVDTGEVWTLQGFYDRTARDLIEFGLLSPRGG